MTQEHEVRTITQQSVEQREAEELRNMLASLAWSSHPRGIEYVEARMPRVYEAVTAALSQSQSAQAGGGEAVAVGTVLGGEFHYLRPSHGLPDGTMLYTAPPAPPAAAAVPEGFVLVPMAPTEEIMRAIHGVYDVARERWKDALAAAQKDGA